jgi:hypothetical protein
MMNRCTENVTLSRTKKMWQDSEIWLQVECSVRQICSRLGHQEVAIRAVVDDITAGYVAIDPALEKLCGKTCVCCSDICCLKATVWYDLRDLLFLYLSSGKLPTHQIHRHSDNSCCHLCPTGCVLARHERPFICSWYICSMQKSLLETQAKSGCENNLSRKISHIQAKRKILEDMCISAITCG